MRNSAMSPALELAVGTRFISHHLSGKAYLVRRQWVSFVFDGQKNRISIAPEGDLHVASLQPVLDGVLEKPSEELSDPVVLTAKP